MSFQHTYMEGDSTAALALILNSCVKPVVATPILQPDETMRSKSSSAEAPVAPQESTNAVEPIIVNDLEPGSSKDIGQPGSSRDQPISSKAKPISGKRKPAPGPSRARPAKQQRVEEVENNRVDKIESNSVACKNVLEMYMEIPSVSAPMNACAFMLQQIRGHPETFEIDAADRSLTITGRMSLPSLHNNAPEYEGNTHFTRFVNPEVNLARFDIDFGVGIKVDPLSTSSASPVMLNGYVSMRLVADRLRSEYEMARPLAEGLAPSFLIGCDRYDLSALWCIGHIIEQQLRDIEALNIVPIFGGALAHDLAYVDLAPAMAMVQPTHLIIKNGICDDTLFVDARQMGDMDLRVIRLLSIGPSGITTGNEELNHTMSSVHTPGPLRFLAYGIGERDVPALGQGITARDVHATLNVLAIHLRAEGMALCGMMRAHAIICGEVVEEVAPNGLVNSRWMTSLFEMGGIRQPRPIGHNPLWCMAKVETERTYGALFIAEYRLVQAQTRDNSAMILAGVVALISLSISSLLNKFNLTGRELNTYRSHVHQHRPAHVFLEMLFSPHPNDPFYSIRLFSTACAIVSQFTPVSINARVIATPDWCCNNSHAGNQGPTRMWQFLYGLAIPYQVDIASLAWAYTGWLDIWGYTEPAGGFDMRNEVIISGPLANRRIHFRLGDDTYDRRSQSALRYLYVPYGAFAMNILRQHFRIVAPTRVQYMELINNTGTLVIEGQNIDEDARQPVYLNAAFSIHPGSVTSYDWTTDRVNCPVITQANLPDGIFGALARQPDVTCSPYSGLYRDRYVHTLNAEQGDEAFAQLWRARPGDEAPDAALIEEEADGAEN